jgi:thiamine-phosphate pyrophosphorylase
MARSAIDFRLYLVTDRNLARGRTLSSIVASAVAGGATVVQIREKGLDARAFLAEALALRTWLEARGVPLIVNDRLDVALACGAAGVHVGQHDLPCAVVRRLAGPGLLIGVSVSTVAEAVAAEGDGADYLGISPVFDTPTKLDTPAATGLDGVRRIRAAVRLPLVAIGGIHAGNAAAVMAAGADGVAVVSAILAAHDPQRAAEEMRRQIDGAD